MEHVAAVYITVLIKPGMDCGSIYFKLNNY